MDAVTGAALDPAAARLGVGAPVIGLRRRLGAFVGLTKPRVISLLLVTALGGVFVATDGMPPLSVILWTLVGGALAAGGANAINCYLDRDIDEVMGRTKKRAIPSGAVSPRQALAFGLVLGAASFALFALFVNLLSAVLAMLALGYYVFVYTRWLKRSTPSNIVIGGACGALPPVIGWTAVTGELSLLPLWLFAIVFYWTPPHFWALSLLIKQHYERARVPMLPVVRGDEETRRQILWYTLLLVSLTVMLVPFGMMGLLYLAGALALGGLFVYRAARLLAEATTGAARQLYKYSLYYLALLFVVMVVDRRIPL